MKEFKVIKWDDSSSDLHGYIVMQDGILSSYIDKNGVIDRESGKTRPLRLGDQLYRTREEAEIALAKYILMEGAG